MLENKVLKFHFQLLGYSVLLTDLSIFFPLTAKKKKQKQTQTLFSLM